MSQIGDAPRSLPGCGSGPALGSAGTASSWDLDVDLSQPRLVVGLLGTSQL